MAGKKRIDQIAAEIEAHRARQGGDKLAEFLRTLPDETLKHSIARLEAGADPVEILKEIMD